MTTYHRSVTKKNCDIDVMYVLDIINGGDTCTTISNGTLSYDSVHLMDLPFNATSRYLCPNDHISFSLTDYIDICAYAGGNIHFELVMKNNQSEINISKASFELIELVLPYPHPTTVPSSQPSPLSQPPSSPHPSPLHTYICDSFISTISFNYSQKVCRPESSHLKKKSNRRVLKGKGDKRIKGGKGTNGGKGKGSTRTSTNFLCEDYDDLEEHVNIFVFSKANQKIYYDGAVCVDENFHISFQNSDFLEPKLDFFIYSKDNRLLQWFQMDMCSMDQNSIDKSFGTVKLIALDQWYGKWYFH